MKLFELLDDDLSIDDIIALIRKNCGPFLKECDSPLWRGLYADKLKQLSPYFYEGVVRKDRRPKDLNAKYHNAMNTAFEKQFGIALRAESLFCTHDRTVAGGYGAGGAHLILPIGKFEGFWSTQIKDPWIAFQTKWGEWDDTLKERVMKAADELGIEYKIRFNTITNKHYADLYMIEGDDRVKIVSALLADKEDPLYHKGNLDAADGEIMLVCDKFYALDGGFLSSTLKVNGSQFLEMLQSK